jgi:hypothetical protein
MDPLIVALLPLILFKAAAFVVIAWWALRTPPPDGDEGWGWGHGGTSRGPERPRPPGGRHAPLRDRPHGSPARRPLRLERRRARALTPQR